MTTFWECTRPKRAQLLPAQDQVEHEAPPIVRPRSPKMLKNLLVRAARFFQSVSEDR